MNVGRKTIITDELVQEIEHLKEKGLSIKDIALKTKVSRSTVYKVLKEYLHYESEYTLKKLKLDVN